MSYYYDTNYPLSPVGSGSWPLNYSATSQFHEATEMTYQYSDDSSHGSHSPASSETSSIPHDHRHHSYAGSSNYRYGADYGGGSGSNYSSNYGTGSREQSRFSPPTQASVPVASYSQHSQDGPDAYTCLAPGCTSKPFKRKADLERHYKQIHQDPSSKEAHPCDYPKCSRAQEPFGRRDHFRDHLRDYHKEDIGKRGSQPDASWLKDRVYYPNWWRCTKCLARVIIQNHRYQCPDCKSPCEDKRMQARKRYFERYNGFAE